MKHLVFDFETTGLLKPYGSPIYDQPHSIEFFGYILDNDFRKGYSFGTLLKPPKPISKFIEKHTKINNNMLSNAPTFKDVCSNILGCFEDIDVIVAQNANFDMGVLYYELKRLNLTEFYPKRKEIYCTVEQSMWIKGYRLKNDELYNIATGRTLLNAHRAKNDVLATIESYKYLRRKEREAFRRHSKRS
jgi:DNA polymerase III epsilon subunit-like protein